MRVAIPICRGRISPVFDVAQSLRLVDIEDRALASHAELTIRGNRTRALADHVVDVLICAGISREIENTLRAQGIDVISGICGLVDEVVEAYLDGGLGGGRHTMPGGRHHHNRRALTKDDPIAITEVDLVHIEGNEIRVKGLDAFDGAPVLDLKPEWPGKV